MANKNKQFLARYGEDEVVYDRRGQRRVIKRRTVTTSGKKWPEARVDKISYARPDRHGKTDKS